MEHFADELNKQKKSSVESLVDNRDFRTDYGQNVEIEYHNHRNPADGSLVETVHGSQVRYTLDVVLGDFKNTDFIEAWMEGGWWGGRVLRGNQDSTIVYFGYKLIGAQHVVIPKAQLRFHQKWCRSGIYGIWQRVPRVRKIWRKTYGVDAWVMINNLKKPSPLTLSTTLSFNERQKSVLIFIFFCSKRLKKV
ncbi:hypothetical protein LXL04_023701 [Taraxacum kok-saghyz]